MKYADKIGAGYCIVLGDKELDSKKAEIKNMKTGDVSACDISDIPDFITELSRKEALNLLEESVISGEVL